MAHFTPDGWHTVTPRIVVEGARDCVAFIKRAFGATGDYRAEAPAVLTLGDSIVMVSDVGARGASTAFLYLYVADADETFRRAVTAGAQIGRAHV